MRSLTSKIDLPRDAHVICVCRGIGFPHGMAQTHRIRMIGKAAIEGGMKFTVIHIGGSPTRFNSLAKGEYEGIAYEYLPGQLATPAQRLAKMLFYAHGALQAIGRILNFHGGTTRICVYAWVGRGCFGMLFKSLLRLMGVPVVQEVNEWWPGRVEWVRNIVNLAVTRGSLVISKGIEDRLEGLCSRFYLTNSLLRVPVLADAQEYALPVSEDVSVSDLPYFLWCGNVAGYLRDIQFMIEALALVAVSGRRCRLVLAGTASADAKDTVRRYMAAADLSEESVSISGYVSDEQLKELMGGARGLLLPLWDDDRSRCRFPNKLGEYLFCGRPVISCAVGDLMEFLTDGMTAHLCRPGDIADYAERICAVLDDPNKAQQMGRRGREHALSRLDWRGNAADIAKYFRLVASAG